MWHQIEPLWLDVVPELCHDGVMDLTTYVSGLERDFATLAEACGDEARALVERLTGSLEPAIRMTLLDALSAAAEEITRDLAPGSVELRLRGREPDFVVTAPSVEPVVDGPNSRINVRLPERLKAAIEQAAAGEGRSVSAWLVLAASAALPRSEGLPEPHGKRTRQHVTGWAH
jgi:hypothetical protein